MPSSTSQSQIKNSCGFTINKKVQTRMNTLHRREPCSSGECSSSGWCKKWTLSSISSTSCALQKTHELQFWYGFGKSSLSFSTIVSYFLKKCLHDVWETNVARGARRHQLKYKCSVWDSCWREYQWAGILQCHPHFATIINVDEFSKMTSWVREQELVARNILKRMSYQIDSFR